MVSDEALAVRPARENDETAIRSLIAAAYSMYEARMSMPPAPMLADYGRLIREGAVDVVTTADGLAAVLVSWSEGDHLYVDNVAVAASAQGRGIAALLLGHADHKATQLGLPEIRLYTNELMTENIDYYQRRGFVETGRRTVGAYRRVYFTRPGDGQRVDAPGEQTKPNRSARERNGSSPQEHAGLRRRGAG